MLIYRKKLSHKYKVTDLEIDVLYIRPHIKSKHDRAPEGKIEV